MKYGASCAAQGFIPLQGMLDLVGTSPSSPRENQVTSTFPHAHLCFLERVSYRRISEIGLNTLLLSELRLSSQFLLKKYRFLFFFFSFLEKS